MEGALIMAPLHPHTPVIIGVGQSNDRVGEPGYRAASASDLAAEAAKRAIENTQASGDVRSLIELIITTRTFEDSTPLPAPFGKSANFPRSVASRLGINPPAAVWAQAGGNSSQDAVSELFERVGSGEIGLALAAGAEAISTVKAALGEGRKLDFSEDPGGTVEDRGQGLEGVIDSLTTKHGLTNAPVGYALFENARRARLNLSRSDYLQAMADLFAPFAAVAHQNPYAAWNVPAYKPDDLIRIDSHNRWIADPYPLRLVARDQVNLGAAVLVASLATADRLGVPEDHRVYLHGYAKAREKLVLERPDLSVSPAARAVTALTLARAGIGPDDLSAFDFYSCFPIAVFNAACDGLGLSPADPRGLTVTGGLPYFGGPGNNYSMHAIASMVDRVRQKPGSYGFVGANGGFMSKYSAAVYTTTPREWQKHNDKDLQRELDGAPSPVIAERYEGQGQIETYTVEYKRGTPDRAIVIGRTTDQRRFIARSAAGDTKTVQAMTQLDPLGAAVEVRTSPSGENEFLLTATA